MDGIDSVLDNHTIRSVPRDTMHRPVLPAASHALAAGSQKGRAASRVLGAL